MMVVSGTRGADLPEMVCVRLAEIGQPQRRMRVARVKAGEWRASNVGRLEVFSMEFPRNQSSGTFHPKIYMEWNHLLLGLWFYGKFHGILPASISIRPTSTTNLIALVSIN
jgi:hypothetical protein